nr:GNAT family N-acetyltransferase [Chitinophagales bacterium]
DVKTATTDTDILKCWQVMFELRPYLKEENFPLDMRRTLDDNRKLIYIEEEKVAVAASVFEEGYNFISW